MIAFVEVEQTDAATLTNTIKDVLVRSDLDLSNCRGQAYDGALPELLPVYRKNNQRHIMFTVLLTA